MLWIFFCLGVPVQFECFLCVYVFVIYCIILFMSCIAYHIIVMFVPRQNCSSGSLYMAISYNRYSFI